MTTHNDWPISIAPDLSMPLEATTQTFAILAKRGAGKTYTASVLVEELLGAGSQVLVIDPLDAWWGLRASADGDGPGLPIVVLGGAHGDLPLDATSGEVIADLVVEGRVSAVLSLRHLSKTEQRSFVARFCERLYHRKGEDRHRSPLHVVIDEADAYVPQRVMADTARVMGAVDDLVRRGRSSGIGVTLITQRASVIHKDVLTQIEVLIALRTVSPQDRKAIETWIEAHDPDDQAHELLGSLASLPVGTAWVWSPGWLEVLQRVRIRQRRTYDSSSTPAVGDEPIQPRRLAPVDLELLRERLDAAVERAESDDPTKLRKRIKDLERQLREVPSPEPITVVEYRTPPEVLAELRRGRELLAHVQSEVASAILAVDAVIAKVVRGPEGPEVQERPLVPSEPRKAHTMNTRSDNGLRRGERVMLQVLARIKRPVTRVQLGTLSGFAPGGGTFGTYFGNLKRNGLIADDLGQVSITSNGIEELAGDIPASPQTTQDLLDLWRSNLRAGERRMLDELVAVYPDSLSRQDLGERSGFAVSGGTFGTYLGSLRRNGLVNVNGPEVCASEVLFIG